MSKSIFSRLSAGTQLFISLLAVAPVALQGADVPGFTTIPTPEGAVSVSLFALTEDGRTAVGQAGLENATSDPYIFSPDGGAQRVPGIAGEKKALALNVLGRAQSITPDGRIIVGRSWNAEGLLIPFRHDTTTGETLSLGGLGGTFNGVIGRANDVSDEGTVVVGHAIDEASWFRAFRWTETEGLVQLPGPSVRPEGILEISTWAYAVSGEGNRVAGYAFYFVDDGEGGVFQQNQGVFVWDEKRGMRILPNLREGGNSSIWDISKDGNKVIGFSEVELSPGEIAQEAVLWDFDTLQPTRLGIPEGWEWSHAISTDRSGSVVTGYIGRIENPGTDEERVTFHAMIWTPQLGIHDLNDFLANRYGINLEDHLLVSANISANGQHLFGTARQLSMEEEVPFILELPSPLTAHGFFFFNPPEQSDYVSLFDVSDDGRVIVGQSGDTNNIGRPFAWTPGRDSFYVPLVEGSDPATAPNRLGRLQAVTPDGRYAVGRIWNADNNLQAFRYDIQTDVVELLGAADNVDPAGLVSRATDISDDGSVVVGHSVVPGAWAAFRWTESSGMQLIPMEAIELVPGAEWLSTWAYQVSSDGNRIAGYLFFMRMGENGLETVNQRIFVWDPERGVRVLEALRADGFDNIWSISGDGSRIVGTVQYTTPDGAIRFEAVYWNFEDLSVHSLGVPKDWDSTIAYDVNEDGSRITGVMLREVNAGTPEAYVQSHAMTWSTDFQVIDLNYDLPNRYGVDLEGYVLSSANTSANGNYLYGVAEAPDGSGQVGFFFALPSEESPDYRYFQGSYLLEQGWRWSPWFGNHNITSFPWIYHEFHGWLLAGGSGGDQIWLYDPLIGWLFTSPTSYPFLFAAEGQARWLFYYNGTRDPRWFFDYGLDDYIAL